MCVSDCVLPHTWNITKSNKDKETVREGGRQWGWRKGTIPPNAHTVHTNTNVWEAYTVMREVASRYDTHLDIQTPKASPTGVWNRECQRDSTTLYNTSTHREHSSLGVSLSLLCVCVLCSAKKEGDDIEKEWKRPNKLIIIKKRGEAPNNFLFPSLYFFFTKDLFRKTLKK